MKEIWKPIKGYEGYYEISSYGRLRSCDRIIVQGKNFLHLKGRFMCPSICRSTGYYITTLSRNGIKKRKLLHRLIAKAFIPNPDNKPMIDHINGVRTDNGIENLRWCTNRENLTFPIASENRIKCKAPISKKVAQIDRYTQKVIKVFRSTGEVHRQLGFKSPNISRCCRGEKPTAYNYIWRYVE